MRALTIIEANGAANDNSHEFGFERLQDEENVHHTYSLKKECIEHLLQSFHRLDMNYPTQCDAMTG